MKKSTATILTILGILVFFAIVGVAFAAWMFMSNVEMSRTDERSAVAAFEEARKPFAGMEPVFEMRDEDTVTRRRPTPETSSVRLKTMHVLAWDPDEEGLIRVDLPYWLLRLKSGPLEITSDRIPSGRRQRLDITIEELERYGRALLVDFESPDGDRVLIWQE
jgi:hypothetical protein